MPIVPSALIFAPVWSCPKKVISAMTEIVTAPTAVAQRDQRLLELRLRAGRA